MTILRVVVYVTFSAVGLAISIAKVSGGPFNRK